MILFLLHRGVKTVLQWAKMRKRGDELTNFFALEIQYLSVFETPGWILLFSNILRK